MPEQNQGLKQALKSLNTELHQMELEKSNIMDMKKYIVERLGHIFTTHKDFLLKEGENLEVYGVDGSVCDYGGSFPHYFSLCRALAKPMNVKNKEFFLEEIYCPLLQTDIKELKAEEDVRRRRQVMSSLELKCAILCIKEAKPQLLLMDGSLTHYQIDNAELWEELVKEAKGQTIVIGITEEIKTKDIGKAIYEDFNNPAFLNSYDRELIYGILEEGQVLFLNEGYSQKTQHGIRMGFARFSKDMQLIGLDVLEEQYEECLKYLSLLYNMTPRSGRGIPLWLDIVDAEVKITKDMIELLAKEYIDMELRMKYFSPKREHRTL